MAVKMQCFNKHQMDVASRSSYVHSFYAFIYLTARKSRRRQNSFFYTKPDWFFFSYSYSDSVDICVCFNTCRLMYTKKKNFVWKMRAVEKHMIQFVQLWNFLCIYIFFSRALRHKVFFVRTDVFFLFLAVPSNLFFFIFLNKIIFWWLDKWRHLHLSPWHILMALEISYWII